MVIEERVFTRQLIRKWYDRAQIDYSDLFVKVYIAYNAWFRKVTDCQEDHQAIKLVAERFVIWDDYLQGKTLLDLRPIIEEIAAETWRHPLPSIGTTWNGVVKDDTDWKGLIYFWYQTRCHLFHGLIMPGRKTQDKQVRLAYESLNIFMSEIIRRMRHCFTKADYVKLIEVQKLLNDRIGADDGLRTVERRLHHRFIHSPDMWNVDMERA